MDVRIHPAVVVMGVTGSGKTTVGQLLAHQLGVPFADADDFHTPAMKAKMASGQPLDDADRAPWLRRLADWLAAQPGGCVLACSALKRKYRDVLHTGAPQLAFLHLVGEPAVASERVAHRRNHYMPASLVGSQYADLEPLEPDEFGVPVDFTLGPEQIVERFLTEINSKAATVEARAVGARAVGARAVGASGVQARGVQVRGVGARGKAEQTSAGRSAETSADGQQGERE